MKKPRSIRDQAFADSLTHPLAQKVYDYWCENAPAGKLPGRQHLDPLEIPDALPWIAVSDVERAGDDMRFRLRVIGTSIVKYFGRDSTNKWFEEIFCPEILKIQVASYRGVVESGQPKFGPWTHPVTGREPVQYQRLLLPLARDGKSVDMIMLLILSLTGPNATAGL